ncbi:hypothetical protein B0H14DRAFT_3763738 [Mycena olivaceomarginata]|nr:hypothetical protein B0H14DRAFT_3763738 [Mycena olivaceomarginata]
MPIPKQRRESSRHSFVFALDMYHRSCHPKANLSYNTSDVPLELWTIIARFASRQSLARLCSLSHHFCSAFTPLLYSNTIDPPLTAPQSALLIQTLSSDVERCSCPICARTHTLVYGTPHPALATLVRDLGLVGGAGELVLREKPKLLKTLSQLAIAQRLRSLRWSLAAGVDDLGRILGTPGRFPHLKELDVSCNGTNNNFNFALIPRLEVLRLESKMGDSDLEWFGAQKLCYKLAESLPMLQSTSPLLHTLQLKLKIPFDDGFPHAGYSHLVAVINSIHLPVLATLDLSADLIPDDWFGYGYGLPSDLFETDFSPFLTSHPNLSQLTLNVYGTTLTGEETFLSPLHSFQGSFKDAAVLVHEDVYCRELLPSSHIVPLSSCLSLTHLRLFAVDIVGETMKKTDEPVSEIISSISYFIS